MNYNENNHQWTSLSFKNEVATNFEEFSQELSCSPNETMTAMLHFFKIHKISPFDTLNENLASLENTLHKRINALIAIIKNIEKTQTKPTYAMIQLLFQENDLEDETPQYIERRQGNEVEFTQATTDFEQQFLEEEKKNKLLKKQIETLLNNSLPINTPFGNQYYRLEITKEKMESLINEYNHVYQHITSENGG